MKATLDHIEKLSDQVRTFWFKPAQQLDQIAGQFIELTLPHEHPDSRGIRRWFTISSSPTEPLVGITTRLAHKSSSFKLRLQQLKPGDEVTISDPLGDFVLPLDTSTPLLFIVGGMGITPIHSMVKWLVEVRETRPIQLLYSAHHPGDFLFLDTLATAGIKPALFITQPDKSWTGLTGYITAKYITATLQPSNDAYLYISGPEAMVENLQADLQKAGIDGRQIITDSFPGYSSF